MAIASSSARLKALINNGTKSGIKALARFMIFPLSKSAPLAICAFMILSVSSSSVGMNLSAIVIIIASSCAGKPIFLNGLKRYSMPSVNSIGEVVSVRSDVQLAVTTGTLRGDWRQFWPVILILAGLAALIGREDTRRHEPRVPPAPPSAPPPVDRLEILRQIRAGEISAEEGAAILERLSKEHGSGKD